MSVQVVRRGGPRSCAWCRERVGVAARCDACGTALHEACALEHGRCPTLGCAGALELRASARLAPSRPVVGPGVLGLLLAAALLACGLHVALPPWRRRALAEGRGPEAGPGDESARLLGALASLGDLDPEVRRMASQALRNALGRDDPLAPGLRARAGAALARVAALEPDPAVRRAAALRLAALVRTDRAPRLPLDDPSPEVRDACLSALAAAPPPWDEADLERFVTALDPAREPSAGVRARAAVCLAPHRGDRHVRAALLRMSLEDEEPRAQDVAELALGELGSDWWDDCPPAHARRLERLVRATGAADGLLRRASFDALRGAPGHTLASVTRAVDLGALPEPLRGEFVRRLDDLGREPALRSELGGCMELLHPPLAGLRSLNERDPSPIVRGMAREAIIRLHDRDATSEGAARVAARCVPLPSSGGCGNVGRMHTSDCLRVQAALRHQGSAHLRWPRGL